MARRLHELSLHVVDGQSVVAPLLIEGLPARIDVLGMRWQRKREFHLTAVSAEVLQRAGSGRTDLWQRVRDVGAERSIGPIAVRAELRRVRCPGESDLQTLIVMADAAGLGALHHDLSALLGTELRPPPAHVTLYSTDPDQGIGIDDQAQLAERAPELSEGEQEEVRRAMSFAEVFGG